MAVNTSYTLGVYVVTTVFRGLYRFNRQNVSLRRLRLTLLSGIGFILVALTAHSVCKWCYGLIVD